MSTSSSSMWPSKMTTTTNNVISKRISLKSSFISRPLFSTISSSSSSSSSSSLVPSSTILTKSFTPFQILSSSSKTIFTRNQMETRLFGTNPSSSSSSSKTKNEPLGKIFIHDLRTTNSENITTTDNNNSNNNNNNNENILINTNDLYRTISILRYAIGYPSYDITIILVNDEDMILYNSEFRNVSKPTDILSFPALASKEPGKLDEDDVPNANVREYYNLGDIFLDIPYILQCMQEDQNHHQQQHQPQQSSQQEEDADEDNEEDDDEYEYVYEYEEDRGVSLAMSNVYDINIRLQMLLIHGILHLVGYDHENDDDYELMIQKENELLELLKHEMNWTFTPLSSSSD